MVITCNICFDDIKESNIVMCYDYKCDCIICKDCMIKYIDVCETLPKCGSNKCDKFYILGNILDLPKNSICKYNILCLNFLTNNNLEDVKNLISKNDIVEKLREEKCKFIDTFPDAIKTVINICMKTKLKKITKNNIALIDKTINSNGRFCMLSYCNGKLDKDMKCLKCDTLFCLNCEKVKRYDHICKESDIQNIKYIKNISYCPKCTVPIEKYEGCSSVRCVNCSTLFNYYTQKPSDHGGRNIDIKVKDNFRLSNEYKNIYDKEIIKLLIFFEENIPNIDIEKNKNRILNTIKNYILNNKENEQEYASKLSKMYNKNMLIEYKYKLCLQKIAEIEDLHEHNELTYEKLKQIINLKQEYIII